MHVCIHILVTNGNFNNNNLFVLRVCYVHTVIYIYNTSHIHTYICNLNYYHQNYIYTHTHTYIIYDMCD